MASAANRVELLMRAMLLCADAAAFVAIGRGQNRRVIEALPLGPCS